MASRKTGASGDDATKTNTEPAPNVEVLGTVKRVVRRAVTPADRADIDARLHALIEANAANERQQKRAQKALAKLRQRGTAIGEQITELHSKWSAATAEEIHPCRVERTPTEIRIMGPDNTPIYARPLTKDELALLSSRLPNMANAATVHHPEMDQSDEVAEVEKRQLEAKSQQAELAQSLTFEQAIAAVDAEEANDNGTEPEDKPKKGKGKKGKGKGKQLELGGNNDDSDK